jgi:fimbrial chaperone protein
MNRRTSCARRGAMRAALGLALGAGVLCASASEFSVSPISFELKPGALSETVNVTNHASTRLRLAVRVMEWTQDEQGADVYKESGDLVYFPRQMDLEPDARRLVRVGAKAVAPAVERAYRVFVEEQPEASPDPNRAQVSFYFRFSIPVFVPPPQGKAVPEIVEPVLEKGTLAFTLRNGGNQRARITRILVTDDAGYSKELPAWYLLAGRQKSYSAEIPRAACRGAKAFTVRAEGEGVRAERTLNVDPARCG